MNMRDDYPLSTWVIDLRDLMAKREFMKKADALLMIVEDIDDFIDLYNSGCNPQAAYREYSE